jgi:hypothetical protein
MRFTGKDRQELINKLKKVRDPRERDRIIWALAGQEEAVFRSANPDVPPPRSAPGRPGPERPAEHSPDQHRRKTPARVCGSRLLSDLWPRPYRKGRAELYRVPGYRDGNYGPDHGRDLSDHRLGGHLQSDAAPADQTGRGFMRCRGWLTCCCGCIWPMPYY